MGATPVFGGPFGAWAMQPLRPKRSELGTGAPWRPYWPRPPCRPPLPPCPLVTGTNAATAIFATCPSDLHTRLHALATFCKVATPDPDAAYCLFAKVLLAANMPDFTDFGCAHGYW